MVLPTKIGYEMGDKNTARYHTIRHFLLNGLADCTTMESIESALPSNAIVHTSIGEYFAWKRTNEVA